MGKKTLIVSILALFSFVGAGCISITSGPQSNDGGVFKSSDKGEIWEQVNAVPTPQGVGNITNIDVMDLFFDPQDSNAIYLASAGNGLFYTWDGAKSWKYVESLGSGYVNSIVVDHKDKCTLFAALQNKIFKSVDCARTWEPHFYDTRENVYVSSIAVNPNNSKILFAGLSEGGLLKSIDSGDSWSIIHRFKNKVQKIIIHPTNANTILVALERDGLWKSIDAGRTWKELKDELKDFKGANEIFDLDMTKNAEHIYLTSQYGILLSSDLGESWTKVPLLTPENSARIYAFAVNPNNEKEIYYSTASTFYSSSDGGVNWITKKLPTTRAGTAILVDPNNSNLIYMGTRSFKK